MAEYPILEPDERRAVFELSDKAQRIEYFMRAVNSEAFFSFMGGLVVKRHTWDRVPLNPDFIGSCWAHSARFFELMQSGLLVNYTSRVYLQRRGENDSFSNQGLVRRFQIQVEGISQYWAIGFSESKARRRVRSAAQSATNSIAVC